MRVDPSRLWKDILHIEQLQTYTFDALFRHLPKVLLQQHLALVECVVHALINSRRLFEVSCGVDCDVCPLLRAAELTSRSFDLVSREERL